MITTIIFDCFGVLTGDKWKEFLATLPDDIKPPARDLNHALDKGFISQPEFFEQIHDLTGNSPERVEAIINADMHKNVPLFDYIKNLSKTYKIGLLSNVSSDWVRESFLSPKEIKLFKDILLSYDVGLIKPDPAIFKLAASRLQSKPEECIFIDDGPGNCDGAKSIGMQAIVYTNFVQFQKDIEYMLANTNN